MRLLKYGKSIFQKWQKYSLFSVSVFFFKKNYTVVEIIINFHIDFV